MSALVQQRQRIVRVRRIQHGAAASAAVDAAQRVQMIEGNRARLQQMRGELQPSLGPTTGAALARIGELGMRLDAARFGLGTSLGAARAMAASREGERLAARRDQESAEKLEQAAALAADEQTERRLRGVARRRPRFAQGETE
jgi:hypothetical protein